MDPPGVGYQATPDKDMDKGDKPRNQADPQGEQPSPLTPTPAQDFQPDAHCLLAELDAVKDERRLTVEKGLEKRRLLFQWIFHLTKDLERLKALLDLRETAFIAEQKRNKGIISSCKEEICSLKRRLQVQREQLDDVHNLNCQEREKMAAGLEAERRRASEQKHELILLQMKLNQMREEVLTLREEKERLSRGLQETTED